MRKLPLRPTASLFEPRSESVSLARIASTPPSATVAPVGREHRRPVVAPLSEDTFQIQFTAPRAVRDKLRHGTSPMQSRGPCTSGPRGAASSWPRAGEGAARRAVWNSSTSTASRERRYTQWTPSASPVTATTRMLPSSCTVAPTWSGYAASSCRRELPLQGRGHCRRSRSALAPGRALSAPCSDRSLCRPLGHAPRAFPRRPLPLQIAGPRGPAASSSAAMVMISRGW
jgi:hypothetical protein